MTAVCQALPALPDGLRLGRTHRVMSGEDGEHEQADRDDLGFHDQSLS
jgi:hypothetical protein